MLRHADVVCCRSVSPWGAKVSFDAAVCHFRFSQIPIWRVCRQNRLWSHVARLAAGLPFAPTVRFDATVEHRVNRDRFGRI